MLHTTAGAFVVSFLITNGMFMPILYTVQTAAISGAVAGLALLLYRLARQILAPAPRWQGAALADRRADH